jgi:hypothetical protein
MQRMVDVPLADLSDDVLRPSRETLETIMKTF